MPESASGDRGLVDELEDIGFSEVLSVVPRGAVVAVKVLCNLAKTSGREARLEDFRDALELVERGARELEHELIELRVHDDGSSVAVVRDAEVLASGSCDDEAFLVMREVESLEHERIVSAVGGEVAENLISVFGLVADEAPVGGNESLEVADGGLSGDVSIAESG